MQDTFGWLFFHGDRKSTRLNSSHLGISYAVFCLKKKQTETGYHELCTTLDHPSSLLSLRPPCVGGGVPVHATDVVRVPVVCEVFFFFFFNDTATTEIYTLSLHDALPISHLHPAVLPLPAVEAPPRDA